MIEGEIKMRVLTITEKLKIATKLFDEHKLVVEHPGLSYALQIEELRIITKLLNKHGLSAEYLKQCNALQEVSEPSEGTTHKDLSVSAPVIKEEDNSD